MTRPLLLPRYMRCSKFLEVFLQVYKLLDWAVISCVKQPGGSDRLRWFTRVHVCTYRLGHLSLDTRPSFFPKVPCYIPCLDTDFLRIHFPCWACSVCRKGRLVSSLPCTPLSNYPSHLTYLEQHRGVSCILCDASCLRPAHTQSPHRFCSCWVLSKCQTQFEATAVTWLLGSCFLAAGIWCTDYVFDPILDVSSICTFPSFMRRYERAHVFEDVEGWVVRSVRSARWKVWWMWEMSEGVVVWQQMELTGWLLKILQ